MEARRRTRWSDGALILADGARLPLYAGELDYARVDPGEWAPGLRRLRALGFTVVSASVPWRLHEPAPGRFEWQGALDLPAFLAAAAAAELRVVLRVGPSIGLPWTSFGLPDHVLAEEACLAVTSRDTPAWVPAPPRAFPMPSYASAAFRARVREWFGALAGVVTPDGPLVAIGVDRGDYFRGAAFDVDYHADAIAAFGREAPRAWDPAHASRCIEWVRFKEQAHAEALGAFSRMLDEVGLDVARLHELPLGATGEGAAAIADAIADAIDRCAASPSGDAARSGAAVPCGGAIGLPAASGRRQFARLRRRVTLPLASASIGSSAFLPPPELVHDPLRDRDQLLLLLALGARGFELAGLVDTDRHVGALGAPPAWVGALLAALASVDWPSLARPAQVALVRTRADERFGLATSLLDPALPALAEVLDLGPGGAAELGTDAAAIASRRWFEACAAALELAQVPFAILEESALVDDAAPAPRVIVCPTPGRVDRALWLRLRALAESGRAVVVVGPTLPTHDELGAPLADAQPRRLGRLQAASLDDLPGLAADLADLAPPAAGDWADAWTVERPADVRAYAHADAAGAIRAVLLVSDAREARVAILVADSAATGLHDPFTNERLRITGGRANVSLPPRGVRLLLVH
ncbi:MAG TPA: beta-galactosidase [Kofleriaceae bacterium]